MAAKRRKRKKAAPPSTAPPSTPQGVAERTERIHKKMEKLVELMEALDFTEQYHRQPTLNDEQWREAVNKQLDALTLAVRWSVHHQEVTTVHVGGLIAAAEGTQTVTRSIIEQIEQSIAMMGTIVEALNLYGKHLRPPPTKKWSKTLDQNLARLVVIGRLIKTIQGFFGGPHLPP